MSNIPVVRDRRGRPIVTHLGWWRLPWPMTEAELALATFALLGAGLIFIGGGALLSAIVFPGPTLWWLLFPLLGFAAVVLVARLAIREFEPFNRHARWTMVEFAAERPR